MAGSVSTVGIMSSLSFLSLQVRFLNWANVLSSRLVMESFLWPFSLN